MEKIIFTLDIDAFFVACELKRNPNLKNRYLGIGNGANNRSVLSSVDYKSRAKGLYAGIPVYKAKLLIPDLVLLPPDFEYYLEESEQVFQLIKQFSNTIEVSSIDECYLDVTNQLKANNLSPLNYAKKIKSEVFAKRQLTISIGISTNKFLAKMASKIAKPNGIATLYHQEIATKLWPLPIDKMYFSGRATGKIFNKYQIKTIKDLAFLKSNANFEQIKQLTNIGLEKLIENANGIDTQKLDLNFYENKSISLAKTYRYDLFSFEEIKIELEKMLKAIITKMKTDQLIGKVIAIRFKTELSGANKKTQVIQTTLSNWTDEFTTFSFYLEELLATKFVVQKRTRFLSLEIKDLIAKFKSPKQLTLNDFQFISKSIPIKEEIVTTNLQHIVNKLNANINNEMFFLGANNAKFHKNSLNKNSKINFKRWDHK